MGVAFPFAMPTISNGFKNRVLKKIQRFDWGQICPRLIDSSLSSNLLSMISIGAQAETAPSNSNSFFRD